MANPSPTRMKVKLLSGIILQGATEPRGEDQKYGETGQVVDLDIWTAKHLIVCGKAEAFVQKGK